MRNKKIDKDTLRSHYDLSKLQVQRLGEGWNGRNPFSTQDKSTSSETKVIELTLDEANAITELIGKLNEIDIRDLTGTDEAEVNRLLLQAQSVANKLAAA